MSQKLSDELVCGVPLSEANQFMQVHGLLLGISNEAIKVAANALQQQYNLTEQQTTWLLYKLNNYRAVLKAIGQIDASNK